MTHTDSLKRLRQLIAPVRAWVPLVRALALGLMLIIALRELIVRFGAHYPVGEWLFWRYGKYWVLCLGWTLSCLSSGHFVLLRVLGRTLPIREHLTTAFALGVYLFFLAMFAGGLLGLYGPAFFAALPILLFACGARDLGRYGARLVRHIRSCRRTARPEPLWVWPVMAAGLLGVGMVYFAILTPENAGFDSLWQHLGIAEHYAAERAVRRFPEGWYVGTSPHLASFLYTWAFLLPKSILFDRVELAAHIEFTIFLWTLAAIPALVRLLVSGVSPDKVKTRARFAWAGRFLFPGIFVYDSSLTVGADHVAALFAIPVFTLFVRSYRELCPRLCALFGGMVAAAVMTKHTAALMLIIFPALAITARGIFVGLRAMVRRGHNGDGRRAILGLLVLGVVALVLTAPHWLKNWIWYGNPIYPLMASWFPGHHPWTPDSAERWLRFNEHLWKPTRDLAGIQETLKALLTFSVIPNDWPRFHGTIPVFGSLFTVSLFCLPFVRGGRKLWSLFLAVHVGLFAWYFTHHQDRYLQAIAPWMTAATVGVLILAWRSHFLIRTLVASVVGLQIIWGGDVYFIPSHSLIKSPIKVVADLLAAGYRRDFKNRLRVFDNYADAGVSLPEGAKVLVHDTRQHVGIDAASVNDMPMNQGGISYGLLETPRAVYDKLKGYGVTHLLWVTQRSSGDDSLAGDIAFYRFALKYGTRRKQYGILTVAEMPPEPPPPSEAGGAVAVLSCDYRGLYRFADLRVPSWVRNRAAPTPLKVAAPGGEVPAGVLDEADAVVIEAKCRDPMPSEMDSKFTLAAKRRGAIEVWVRAESHEPDRRTPSIPAGPNPLQGDDDLGVPVEARELF